MESHAFNEHQRRFEPRHKKCLYCKEGTENTDMEDNCFYSVYNIQDRTNVIVYRNVKFSEVKIGIPRCRKCRIAHKNARIAVNFSIFVGVLLVFIIPIYFGMVFDLSTVGLIAMLAITVGLLFLVIKEIDQAVLNANDVKSEKEGAMKVPLVREFLRSGWSDTRPSA